MGGTYFSNTKSNYLHNSAEGERIMKSIEKIVSFIKKQKIAFIASIDKNGFPNQKAMLKPRRMILL
jgi:predicted pyridoxine 5'-phosphate oxidase superfamily flavin-nucleotide-binding protein